MTLPVVVPDREPLTEAEARRIGVSAQQIAALRGVLAQEPCSATITIKVAKAGAASLTLGYHDTVAVLALLIEREAALLSSFNVQVAKPSR